MASLRNQATIASAYSSSEMDDPSALDEGFFIAAFLRPIIGAVVGPYPTEDRAVEAMNAGVWMGEHASRLELVNGAYRVKKVLAEPDPPLFLNPIPPASTRLVESPTKPSPGSSRPHRPRNPDLDGFTKRMSEAIRHNLNAKVLAEPDPPRFVKPVPPKK